MNRRTGRKLMWALSVVYGVTVGIVAALGGPVGTVAWVGAVVLGLGWTVSSALLPADRSRQARDA